MQCRNPQMIHPTLHGTNDRRNNRLKQELACPVFWRGQRHFSPMASTQQADLNVAAGKGSIGKIID